MGLLFVLFVLSFPLRLHGLRSISFSLFQNGECGRFGRDLMSTSFVLSQRHINPTASSVYLISANASYDSEIFEETLTGDVLISRYFCVKKLVGYSVYFIAEAKSNRGVDIDVCGGAYSISARLSIQFIFNSLGECVVTMSHLNTKNAVDDEFQNLSWSGSRKNMISREENSNTLIHPIKYTDASLQTILINEMQNGTDSLSNFTNEAILPNVSGLPNLRTLFSANETSAAGKDSMLAVNFTSQVH